jgi:hypothetical protein
MTSSQPAIRLPPEVPDVPASARPGEHALSGARVAWRRVAAVGLTATVTVLGADRLLARIAPVDQTLLQTEHGIQELKNGNPRILVLGSSHARSFPAVRQRIVARTGEKDAMAVVPEEGGTFAAYNWILQNRLRPLVDETNATGGRVRDRLTHFLLIVTHYDACPEGEATGVMSHGWRFHDFAADVNRRGITPQNRNYVRARWNEIWPWSSLVQDRGVFRLAAKLRWSLPGSESHEQALADRYRGAMENAYTTCRDPLQQGRFEETLAYLQGTGLAVTIVLFPLDPLVVSDRSRETTLPRFSSYAAELAARYGARVADMTLNTPLVHADFHRDLDHLTADGNRRFAEWALDHELAFLLDASGGARP